MRSAASRIRIRNAYLNSLRVGSTVVLTHQRSLLAPPLVAFAGTEATVLGLPVHPNTWYRLRTADGRIRCCRSSAFVEGPGPKTPPPFQRTENEYAHILLLLRRPT